MRRVVASMLYLYSLYGPDEPWPTAAPDYGWACGYCGFRPECVWWKDGAVPLGKIPFEAQPDAEYMVLERQLRAVAHRLEIEAEIETRIAASRAIGDEEGHVAWLKDQLETASGPVRLLDPCLEDAAVIVLPMLKPSRAVDLFLATTRRPLREAAPPSPTGGSSTRPPTCSRPAATKT
jgi:hypothetical protein